MIHGIDMASNITKLRQILSPKLKWFAVFLIVITMIGAFLELVGLGLVLPVVTAFVKPEAVTDNEILSRIYRFINPSSIREFLIISVVVVIVFYILKAVFLSFVSYCQATFSTNVGLYITDRMFRNYMNVPYADLLKKTSSEFINKISLINYFSSSFILPLLYIISETFVIALIIGVMLVFMPAITLIVMGAGVAGILLFYLPLKKLIGKWGKQEVLSSAKVISVLRDTLNNIKLVKLMNAQAYFVKEHYQVQKKLKHSTKVLTIFGNLPRFILEAFAVALALGVFLFMVVGNDSPEAIIIKASVFIAAMFRLLPSFTRIQYNIILLRQNSYLFDIIYNDVQLIPAEPGDTTGNIEFKRELELKNITFSYDPSLPPVVEDFSIKIYPFDSIAIVGATGCGKSTLIDIIMGFLKPQKGELLTDGVDIFTNLPAWRSKIGYVAQGIYLSDDSILNNIAFAVPESAIDRERVNEVMKLAQIYDFVQTLPDGADTQVGENGNQLSGGQRQRIAIARALYHSPEILILDEATSALDDETEKAFIDAVAALKGQLTIIMIAHRLTSIQYCDRTISL